MKTRKGKPIAKPALSDEPEKNVFGCRRDRFIVIGDIERTAVFPPVEEWDMYGFPWAANLGGAPKKKGKGQRSRKAKGG